MNYIYKLYCIKLFLNLNFSSHQGIFKYDNIEEYSELDEKSKQLKIENEKQDMVFFNENQILNNKLLENHILITALQEENYLLKKKIEASNVIEEIDVLKRKIVVHIGIHILNLVMHLLNLLYIVKIH